MRFLRVKSAAARLPLERNSGAVEEPVPETEFPPFPRHLFAIVSWGAAATRWLAKTLNSHPEIFATHHLQNTIGEASLNGQRILRAIAFLSKAYIAGGDVHGIAREEIPALRHLLGERLVSVVLVREPIARLKSQFAFFDAYAHTRHWTGLEYLYPLLSNVGLTKKDVFYNQLLVMHGASLLNCIVQERSVGRIYRSEDLTSDAETLATLVTELSQGAITPSEEWTRAALATSRANVRVGSDEYVLTDWHKHVIRTIVEPRAWALYEELGYERPDFVRSTEI